MANVINPVITGGGVRIDQLFYNESPGLTDTQTCNISSSDYKMFKITLQAYTLERGSKNIVYVTYDQLVSGVLVGVVWTSVGQSRLRRAKFNSAKTAIVFNKWTDPYNSACCLCEKVEGIK